ncbi:MAG: SDR family NAD(P)-dependent oxidoreductase, partial [Chloroflexota bacterium]
MSDLLFDLSGRIAVVIGAASGLAQAIALGFAERGVDLVLADINDTGLADTVAQVEALGRRAVPVHCDVSDQAQVTQL